MTIRRASRFPRALAATVAFLALAAGLASCPVEPPLPDDLRAEMRAFVGRISSYARSRRAGFVVIPQNGAELATLDGLPDGPSAESYVLAIDGIGQEDLLYGYAADDEPSPADATEWTKSFLDRFLAAGASVLVIDYCSTPARVEDSISRNVGWGFVPFPAHRRALDAIPPHPATPVGSNDREILSLSEADNFLYLIDPSAFVDRASFVAAVAATDYDLVVVDAFFREGEAFTAADVEAMRAKANGGRRLVVSYMSIGEAEDYRWYWDESWSASPPRWLGPENPSWPGNYKVRYWDPEWQSVIFGSGTAYLDRVLGAGFDGVYLDIIDAFEYWESARDARTHK